MRNRVASSMAVSSSSARAQEPSTRPFAKMGPAKDELTYQRDVAPYYGLFDTLLLPSGNEGTPVVAIEALAAGTPVVATHVGGVPDVVEDGTAGFLAEVGDVEALARALEQLARDPSLREAMGRAGRERTLPRYRVERLVDDVDALYRELLSAHGLPLPRATDAS